MVKKVHFTVLAHDFKLNLAMQQWLNGYRIVPHIIIDRHNIVSARNSAVEQFLAGTGTHLVLLDNGVWPNHTTAPLLDADGEVVYMGHIATGGHPAHLGDGNLGCAAVRFSRQALEAIKPPWFECEYNATGSKVLKCDCSVLRDKLHAAGLGTHMVGTVAHRIEALAEPDGHGGVVISQKQEFLKRKSLDAVNAKG